MENIAELPNYGENAKAQSWFGFGTRLVPFFLAMDAGRTLGMFDFNEFLSFFTLAAFIILSYFLPVPADKPGFASWVVRGLTVVVVGVIGGLGLNVLSEAYFTQHFNFVPMVFLILTGFLCAATQIRGIIGVRLAG